MKRLMWALAGVLLALTARSASAQVSILQPVNPYSRPAISPYLNLNRGGNPAVNYFGLVRPQVETQNFIQQQEILQTRPTVPAETAAAGTGTGHPTRFQSYSQYFLTVGGTRTTGGGSTTAVGVAGTSSTIGIAPTRPAVATGR